MFVCSPALCGLVSVSRQRGLRSSGRCPSSRPSPSQSSTLENWKAPWTRLQIQVDVCLLTGFMWPSVSLHTARLEVIRQVPLVQAITVAILHLRQAPMNKTRFWCLFAVALCSLVSPASRPSRWQSSTSSWLSETPSEQSMAPQLLAFRAGCSQNTWTNIIVNNIYVLLKRSCSWDQGS